MNSKHQPNTNLCLEFESEDSFDSSSIALTYFWNTRVNRFSYFFVSGSKETLISTDGVFCVLYFFSIYIQLLTNEHLLLFCEMRSILATY